MEHGIITVRFSKVRCYVIGKYFQFAKFKTETSANRRQKKRQNFRFASFVRSGRDSNPRAVARKLISSRRYARAFQAIFGIFGSVRPRRKWLKNVDFGRSDQKKPQKYSYRPESILSSVLAQNKLFSAKKQELWQEHQPFQWHIENGLLQGSKHWHIELAHWTLLLRTNII